MIDPHVEPQRLRRDHQGHIVVDVHQVVRKLTGELVADQMVQHVYRLEGGLIRQMEIRAC
jgi:hypothetical protein